MKIERTNNVELAIMLDNLAKEISALDNAFLKKPGEWTTKDYSDVREGILRLYETRIADSAERELIQSKGLTMNNCDKCDKEFQNENLIWISAEDFEPKPNEIISEAIYRMYDALCEDCYKNTINYISKEEEYINCKICGEEFIIDDGHHCSKL